MDRPPGCSRRGANIERRQADSLYRGPVFAAGMLLLTVGRRQSGLAVPRGSSRSRSVPRARGEWAGHLGWIRAEDWIGIFGEKNLRRQPRFWSDRRRRPRSLFGSRGRWDRYRSLRTATRGNPAASALLKWMTTAKPKQRSQLSTAPTSPGAMSSSTRLVLAPTAAAAGVVGAAAVGNRRSHGLKKGSATTVSPEAPLSEDASFIRFRMGRLRVEVCNDRPLHLDPFLSAKVYVLQLCFRRLS